MSVIPSLRVKLPRAARVSWKEALTHVMRYGSLVVTGAAKIVSPEIVSDVFIATPSGGSSPREEGSPPKTLLRAVRTHIHYTDVAVWSLLRWQYDSHTGAQRRDDGGLALAVQFEQSGAVRAPF